MFRADIRDNKSTPPPRGVTATEIAVIVIMFGYFWLRMLVLSHGQINLIGDIYHALSGNPARTGATASAPLAAAPETGLQKQGTSQPIPLTGTLAPSHEAGTCPSGEPNCNDARALVQPTSPYAVPLIGMGHIALTNSMRNMQSIDDEPKTTFARDEIRYLKFEASVTRDLVSAEYPLGVTLMAKVVSPSGQILQGSYIDGGVHGVSPEGYSFPITVHFFPNDLVTSLIGQWGNDKPGDSYSEPGLWRIEFYYGDKKIGETVFAVE